MQNITNVNANKVSNGRRSKNDMKCMNKWERGWRINESIKKIGREHMRKKTETEYCGEAGGKTNMWKRRDDTAAELDEMGEMGGV